MATSKSSYVKKRSVFYRLTKFIIKLIQPANALNRSVWGDIALLFALLLFATFSAYPMIFIINNAFKPFNEIFIFPPRLFVRNPTLDNFIDLINLMADSWVPLTRYVFNTLFITIVGTIGHVILASMAAYPLAKHTFYGSSALSKIIV
jgi:ABC-type glycerol-3-phosphate transport system permease component